MELQPECSAVLLLLNSASIYCKFVGLPQATKDCEVEGLPDDKAIYPMLVP